MAEKVEVAIIGGGLSGALTAWRLKTECPDVSFVVIESGSKIGGQHTWSFHVSDLSTVLNDWVAPLVVNKWHGQAVRFPVHERKVTTGYCSISSERLFQVIQPVIQEHLLLGCSVTTIENDAVILSDGKRITAEAILDARGGMPSDAMSFGYQKFVGQFIEMREPHGLDVPIIMDATVDQVDGYRFVYVLPFSKTQLLVEDTRYADGDELAVEDFREAIAQYCRNNGWHPISTVREEQGVLPIALAGNIDEVLAGYEKTIAPIGMKAGLFHPLTGYSLPDAVKTADLVASCVAAEGDLIRRLKAHAKANWNDRAFYRLLSRMLYGAAEPDQRYKVLERFYRLPEKVIERFYAGVSTKADRVRVLAGKPPVPIFKALKCMSETDWLRQRSPVNERQKVERP